MLDAWNHIEKSSNKRLRCSEICHISHLTAYKFKKPFLKIVDNLKRHKHFIYDVSLHSFKAF